MSLDALALLYATQKTALSAKSCEATLELLIKEECTIPFITRYRKERTGGLDEVQIRAIQDSYEEYLEREKRRASILSSLKERELLTPELEKKILAADTINQLEDIYAPFKQKKKTKGMIAKEAGLEPLALLILVTRLSFEEIKAQEASKFLNPEHKVTNIDEAMSGAMDIVTEMMAHDVEVKETLRQDYWKEATLVSVLKKDGEAQKDASKYKDYFEFSQKISELKNPKNSHRYLAMRRGMTQKILKVDVQYSEEAALGLLEKNYFSKSTLGCRAQLHEAARKAYTISIHPSLDLEVKAELKKISDEAAIDVFGVNLKNLLLQPYLGPKTVLGMDPGVRTGVKLAVVDNTGKFIVDTVVYPHPPKSDTATTKKVLEAIIDQFKVEYVAIGNGTYGRETLDFIEEHVRQIKDGSVKATLISEAGASIYSASDIARKEFPDKDPTVRGAISIARRFQDPLAELVKIDPKSIGVGQYQHDVNQSRLKKALNGVVESCVNYVGVDLNTASAPLLAYVSGIGEGLAGNVVKYREEKGGLKSREDLLSIPRFSKKVFEQAAGFLRIYNGQEPLDATFIHPERYSILKSWAKKQGRSLQDLVSDPELKQAFEKDQAVKEEIGHFTHEDIVRSLKAPSQDPRTEFKSTEFRKDISKLEDLVVDQWYPGLVTNITQFGAFVDIGLKENGLLHVSQIADKFVENPLEELSVGQEVKVRVIGVDFDRRRISLSCKLGDKSSEAGRSHQAPRPQAQTNSDRSRPNKRNNEPPRPSAFAALKDFKVGGSKR
jgi:protein Tex